MRLIPFAVWCCCCCWLTLSAALVRRKVSGKCPDSLPEELRPTASAVRLSDASLALLGNMTRAERLRELARPLLLPRPVGSPGHAAVLARLAGFMRDRLGWRVEEDRFEAETPLGRRLFASLVATRPRQRRQQSRSALVLAAHYDSLAGPGFVGATDSAVPCAILLMLAEALNALTPPNGDSTVRIVFFDGEESLGGDTADGWTPMETSLYGSRHLAARWTLKPKKPGRPATIPEVSELVLLDLIGAPNPRLCYLAAPAQASSPRIGAQERRDFRRLVAMETRLRAGGHLPEMAGQPVIFLLSGGRCKLQLDDVLDDDAPFRRLGVPTLHLMPRPFPRVWHTVRDTGGRVHWGHSAALARVLLGWLLEAI